MGVERILKILYRFSLCHSLVDYGNTDITKHALKVLVFKTFKLDTIIIVCVCVCVYGRTKDEHRLDQAQVVFKNLAFDSDTESEKNATITFFSLQLELLLNYPQLLII